MHKDALLGVTARLLVHFENASDRLYRDGELTADGEVRALVPRVLDLARLVRENLADLSDGADPADPFAPTIAQSAAQTPPPAAYAVSEDRADGG